MAKFPTTPIPSYSQVVEVEYKTIISMFDDGSEQRRAKWDFPKTNIEVYYNALPSSSINTLWDFYRARRGSYEAFHFYLGEAESQSYNESSMYVATADGASTTYPMPCKNSTITDLYVDGSSQGSSLYNVTSTDGVDDCDTLHLAFTPASGEVLTVSFDGYPKYRVRFAEDKMSKELFERSLYKTGLKLKGLGSTA